MRKAEWLMKTNTKYTIGALVLVATGGLVWWNRYTVLVVNGESKTAATANAKRTYAFTESGARAAAVAAIKTAAKGYVVYITRKKQIVAAFRPDGREWLGENLQEMTADAVKRGLPLAGMR